MLQHVHHVRAADARRVIEARFLETSAVEVSFPVLLDIDRAVTKAWGVSILPTTFVLDRKRVVRLSVEGDVDWLQPDILAALERVGGPE